MAGEARKWARILNGIGWVTGAWAFFIPRPFGLAIIVAMVVPIAAILSMRFFPQVMKFEGKKGSNTPAVMSAFTIPILGLAMAAVRIHVLEWRAFWAPFILFSAGIFALAMYYAEDVRAKVSIWLPVLLICFVYGFGATITLNRAFDGSVPTAYEAQVMGKRINKRKSDSYHIKLSPWGPRTGAKEVQVSKSFYEARNEGDTVRVLVKAGALWIPWFYVR